MDTSFATQSDEELLTSIAMLEKKVARLAKQGTGAAMATAANNSYLRKMKAAANERGIIVPVAA